MHCTLFIYFFTGCTQVIHCTYVSLRFVHWLDIVRTFLYRLYIGYTLYICSFTGCTLVRYCTYVPLQVTLVRYCTYVPLQVVHWLYIVHIFLYRFYTGYTLYICSFTGCTLVIHCTYIPLQVVHWLAAGKLKKDLADLNSGTSPYNPNAKKVKN